MHSHSLRTLVLTRAYIDYHDMSYSIISMTHKLAEDGGYWLNFVHFSLPSHILLSMASILSSTCTAGTAFSVVYAWGP
jgi:hypothetical protein